MKSVIFIDGGNLYRSSRSLERDIDYRLLLDYFSAEYNLLRAYYYAAIRDSDEYTPLKPLIDFLAYNGYVIQSKVAKEFVDGSGHKHVRGNMDVEIAVDMMDLSQHVDHIILFAGSSDLRRAIEFSQKRCRVTVISSLGPVSFVSDELRRQCDEFIDLKTVIDKFARREVSRRVELASA